MLRVVLVLLVQFLIRGDAQSEGGILDGMLKPLLKQINSFSRSHETKSSFHRAPNRQDHQKYDKLVNLLNNIQNTVSMILANQEKKFYHLDHHLDYSVRQRARPGPSDGIIGDNVRRSG